MKFTRTFAFDTHDPYSDITWVRRTAQITDDKGKVIFEQHLVEVPSTWSQRALNIVASKYFYGEQGRRENSVRNLIDRIVMGITMTGEKLGYFDQHEDAVNFECDLKWLLAHQHGAFNSPVWFNVGLSEAYGTSSSRSQETFCQDYGSKEPNVVPCTDSYARPQASACFIQSVNDDLGSIMDLAKSEAMLFKYGSGSGTNLSNLRSTHEKLSGGGRPSGPLSFMRVFDQVAGVIKSGGKCLAPTQKVYTSNGPVMVKDLVDRDFVCISYDPPTGQVKAKKARAWLSGEKELVRVTTDKGVFDTSADHPFILAGTRKCVRAGELKVGSRLFAGHINRYTGYYRVHEGGGRHNSRYLHRMVAEDINSSRLDGKVVHHADGNKDDNNPGNLRVLTQWVSSNAKEYRQTQGKLLKRSGRAKSMQQLASRKKMMNTAWTLLNAGYTIDTWDDYVVAREQYYGRIADRNKNYTAICAYFGSYADFIDCVKTENHVVESVESIGLSPVYSVEVDCPTADDKTPDSGHNYLIWSGDGNTGTGVFVSNTRRAAKMQILDVSHPDIWDFINCKTREEEKAWALIDQGYDGSFGGEAYSSVMFQNANLSVRLSDKFMEAVKNNGLWSTTSVTTGESIGSWPARDILAGIAKGTWTCGDPGVQFDDTINRWHTCPNSGRINASNPCQPGTATLLTPEGIRTMESIRVGDVIWSGKRWTTVTRKVATGIKPVYNYVTNAGVFSGTEQHRVVENGVKVEVGTAQSIDVATGGLHLPLDRSPAQGIATLAGLLLGDGAYKVCNDGKSSYCLLYVGENDSSYFDDPFVGSLIERTPFDKTAHRLTVEAPLGRRELPYTYARTIPERYLQGNASTICAFLRGLYSANGSICGGRITLKASSFAVIQGVQQMLSAVGIRSYYTTNKAKIVEFSNGAYECKQSYDLNITSDKKLFASNIGFIQPYKTHKLNDLIRDGKARNYTKTSYDIHTRKYVGDLPVYDITVDAEEHTYWTGGLLVSNCSEFMFIDNSACNLASLNLLKFYDDSMAEFDFGRFEAAIRLFITAQDILVTYSSYPTREIAYNSNAYRPLGLGYANLGAWLMRCGIPYDSDKGRLYAALITSFMTAAAYKASGELAESLGAFKHYDSNDSMMAVLNNHVEAHRKLANKCSLPKTSEWYDAADKVWSDLQRKDLAGVGFRNAQVTLLAPTGTIGFLMDCDTTGIEPELALVKYKNLAGGGTMQIDNQSVEQALKALHYHGNDRKELLRYLEKHGSLEGSSLSPEELPVFDCAMKPLNGTRSIRYEAHLKMMAAVQPFLSGAISKTINVPNECTVDEIMEIYVHAWQMGLKAVAIYRDGSKRTQPLNVSKTKVPEPKAPAVPVTEERSPRQRLPATRTSITHKFEIGGHEGYFTVGLYDDGRPGELFVTMAKEGSTIGGLMNSFGTAISLCLQYGVPLKTLYNKFSYSQFEPSGYTTNPEIPIAKSLVDYIFRWMDLRFREAEPVQPAKTAIKAETKVETKVEVPGRAVRGNTDDSPPCDLCGHITVRNASCYRCPNCGNSMGCS